MISSRYVPHRFRVLAFVLGLLLIAISFLLSGCSILGLYGDPAFPGPPTPGLDGTTTVYAYGPSGQRLGTAVIGGSGVLLYTPSGARAGTGLRGR